jgi:hypothetical protein
MTVGLLKRLKHADVMKAFVEGAEVQARDRRPGAEWYSTSTPTWRPDYDYRVKPAEPVVLYVRRDNLADPWARVLKTVQYERIADWERKEYVQFIEVQD